MTCLFGIILQTSLLNVICTKKQLVERPGQYHITAYVLLRTSSQSLCSLCCHLPLAPSTKFTKRVNLFTVSGDACAAVLLACLFCRPLDCLLATLSGCNMCLCSLCSSICGCEPTVLQPFMNVSGCCELCGGLGARCCLCDCPVCDICLQATECLDLAMEISQMLYH